MLIAHVIQRLDDGGAARTVLDLIAEDPSGHRIVSLLASSSTARTVVAALGCHLVECPSEAQLDAELATADVVVLHWWNSPELADVLARPLPAMRVMGWVHVGGAHAPQMVTADLCEFVDLLVAGTPFTLELPVVTAAAARRPEGWARLVVPTVAETKGIAPPADERHDTDRPFTIGYVGTVDTVKLHPRFVEMCAAIDGDVRIVVAGGGGALPDLRRTAEHLGLGGRLDLLGPVADVGAVLARCDVFGYPLCADTYASTERVLIEAMRAGVPPVLLAHGAPPRTIRHGTSGIVADSEAAWSAAIAALRADPVERARLAEGARRHAAEEYTASRSRDQFAAAARACVADPRRNRSPLPLPAGGAARFAALLGEAGAPFRSSLGAPTTAARLAADAVIATASPVVASAGGGGIVHFRNHYRHDPHLRLWCGLILAASGRRAAGIAEIIAARRLGLDDERLDVHLTGLVDAVAGER